MDDARDRTACLGAHGQHVAVAVRRDPVGLEREEIDPIDVTMFAFGGAGPLHAARLAKELTGRGIPAVPVFWLATADHDRVRDYIIAHKLERPTGLGRRALRIGRSIGSRGARGLFRRTFKETS